MPNKKLKRIKMEPGVGEQEEEEGDAAADEQAQQQQQQQQHASLRRKVDEDGLAVPEMRSQIVSLRAHAETQAAVIRGMEQARVMGEQVVELKAEIRIKDAALQANDSVLQATIQAKDAALQASAVALQAKDVAMQSKDAVIEGKNALLQSKDAIIVAKDAVIVAKDAEIQRLQAELARCGADVAVGGGARPAPAPARAATAAAAHAPVPVPAPAPAPAPAPPPAAIAVAAAAAAAAPPAPAALFPFSSRAEHKAPDVVISPDRLTVTRPKAKSASFGWARSERGFAAGCGVVRWALQLGQEAAAVRCGGWAFRFGVASDAFSGYTECLPKQAWFFQDICFFAGDVVTFELERTIDYYGVLRVQVAGSKARELKGLGSKARELKGLPWDGMLYPIVGLFNKKQRYTMVALP